MKVSNVCKSYFSGFQEISNFKKNDNKTNALALLKILSYFTVVIPLVFAAVYGAASLCGRVSKKYDLSSHDKNINDQAKKIILNRREQESFQVKIQKINGIDKIPYADFGILDIKMNEKILELLIEYQSQENLEVQLLQDEQSGKLYLGGGKTDQSVKTAPGSFSSCFSLARIFIDLSPLEAMAKIDIYEKIPVIYTREGNNNQVVKKVSEDSLITVLNFTDCRVRMFGSSINRYI